MSKPERFISNSDYASLKNDGVTTLTVTFDEPTIPASTTVVRTATATVGQAGATDRAQIHSSKLGNRYLGNTLLVARTGNDGFGPVSYSIVAELFRSSPDVVTASVSVRNPYGSTLTTEAGAETFTFYVATFIPPFA